MLNWDERRNIEIPGNYEDSLQFCAKHFIQTYETALKDHGSFFVALSGGSTPKALFTLLTKPPLSLKIDWSKVHLFWSDERAVPKDHPDSNFHMAMEAGFAKAGIPESQIHRMKAENNIEEESLSYEKLLESQLKGKGFDLVMLGMGEDGHTASLFPGTEGLKSHGRLVIANYIPQKNTWRMTLTFDSINASKNIVIYVLGKSKQDMLRLVLNSKDFLYPIEKVGTKEHKALWIVDKEAGEFLL